MIPWIRNATAVCGSCTEPFHYDTALSTRPPRICPRCKIDRIAKGDLARRTKLKAATAEMPGSEIEHLAVRTYESVAEEMGISAEAVRKLERSALAKLRKILIVGNKAALPQ